MSNAPFPSPDGSPPPIKLYGAGEVLRHAGISRQMLHMYSAMGLIQPREVLSSGRKWYGEDVFERLKRIAKLKQTMTLAQILELFRKESE
jgi:DNA-binding transcriptional MerR regulator